MLSFQAIVSAVVAELEKAKQLKLDAAATTRTFEQALADIGQNIGGGAIPQAKQMILENAPKLGTTNEGLADLLGVAISAGAKDLQEAMSLVSATLKLTVGDAQKARALVGGTLDVASLGGSQNFEGALGQLLQTQSQVRSTNLAEFSANIGPGLAAATADLSQQKGVSTERGLEMASVISQIIKDQTGSNTATTMRMMFTRMGAFVPEKEKKLDDGEVTKVSRQQIAAFQSLETFDERLKMMQDVPAIGKQFLETQRESIGKTAIAEIIGKSARAVAFEEKAKQNISSIDAAQGFFSDLDKALKGETAQLGAERKAQANIAAAEVTGNRDLEGTVIKIVDDAIAKVNLSGLDYFDTETLLQNNMRAGAAIGANPIDVGIDTLQRAQENRRVFGVIPAGGTVSLGDKALLQSQIAVLEELKTSAVAIERQQTVSKANELTRITDANADNKITGDEAAGMLLKFREKGQLTEEMRASVVNADKEKKGYLTPEELTAALIQNDGFRELITEMRSVREAIVAGRPTQKQPVPQVRPQVAPLPAATAP